MRTLHTYYLNGRFVDKKDIPCNAIFVKRVKCKEFLYHEDRNSIIIEKYYITNQKLNQMTYKLKQMAVVTRKGKNNQNSNPLTEAIAKRQAKKDIKAQKKADKGA